MPNYSRTGSKVTKQSDPAVEAAEGSTLRRRLGGRPPNPLPYKTIARALLPIEEVLEEKGPEGVDMPLSGHKLAIIAAIVMERAFLSEDFTLERKVDWALRVNGLLNQMKTGFVKKGRTIYPKTVEEAQVEEQERRAKIEKLVAFINTKQLPAAVEVIEAEELDKSNGAEEGEL